MNHLKNALINTVILSAILLTIAAYHDYTYIDTAFIPIATVVFFNFIKAAFKIYSDHKKMI